MGKKQKTGLGGNTPFDDVTTIDTVGKICFNRLNEFGHIDTFQCL